jgi:hypothetical protein
MKKLFIIAIFLTASFNSYAATAYWTGYIQFITTVTYKQGVECGYSYNGQIIYRVFLGGSCPRSIEVN